MTSSHLDRLLSSGLTDAIPDRLARYVRVTNALALLAFGLTLLGTPLDIVGAPLAVVLVDLGALAAFAGCWVMNARGMPNAARVTLLVATNLLMVFGVLGLGGVPELRTVFFPLVLMPFLVFDVADERVPLAVFVALPIAAYFVTGQAELPPPGFALDVDRLLTPVLSFLLIVAGSLVFGYVERSAEQRVLHARAIATQNARLVALGEMSSGIAHEIKNPLAAIHLAATQIAARPADEKLVSELGERIQRIVMRTSHIIDGLRSFARDTGNDPMVPVAVERIVEDALELCGKRLEVHGVRLEVAVAPALVVECRPVQLCQIIVNLLGNAHDAVTDASARGERWIAIAAREHDNGIEIAVSDSGGGVPAGARLRIFEPFFSTKAPDRGTGIGLSLSRGIAQAHGGSLELDTSAAHTRLVLRIPRSQRGG